MRQIVVIAHNIRSTHNVGALLRTCDGLGINKVYLTGYTPYPKQAADKRLPHLSTKIDKQIHKTALGAENSLPWEHNENILDVLGVLKEQGYKVAALEQSKNSIALADFRPPEKTALLLGSEVEGLDSKLLSLASATLEIPMFGEKESFNVVQAAAMALYHLRFASNVG
ncbi:TrmH family RNA methyltransferase [Candidatus Parcubacteria bacterium]|nr:TrmH family RNA methyltransferase [Candidatus Parcubacteria bacterium]